jgi:radical SAM protein with 4Fe4S-binding SPASM domain
MVGLPGYHEKAFRLMENLRHAGMKVRVNTVVTPLNLPTLPALIDDLGEMGHVTRVTLSPYARSLFCHRDELFVELEQLDRLRPTLEELRERWPEMTIVLGATALARPEDPEAQRRLWANRSLCTANRHGFVILPDGRVTVCEELYDHPAFLIGDLKTQSVMEMWRSPEALGLAYPDPAAVPDGACAGCSDFEACQTGRGRCWRDVLKTWGPERPHWPDPRCPRAPEGIRLG